MLVICSLSKDIDPICMQMHTAVFGSIICLTGMIFGPLVGVGQLIYIKPETIYWVWLFGVGLFVTISHLMMMILSVF